MNPHIYWVWHFYWCFFVFLSSEEDDENMYLDKQGNCYVPTVLFSFLHFCVDSERDRIRELSRSSWSSVPGISMWSTVRKVFSKLICIWYTCWTRIVTFVDSTLSIRKDGTWMMFKKTTLNRKVWTRMALSRADTSAKVKQPYTWLTLHEVQIVQIWKISGLII